jgi:hypothetical protein
MASLNGQTPANTYEGLLKTNDNGTLPSGADPAESITDGAGNASNLKLHQDKVDFSRIEINGNAGSQRDYLKNNGSGSLVWSQDGLVPSVGTTDQVLTKTAGGYDWADGGIQVRNGYEFGACVPVFATTGMAVSGETDFVNGDYVKIGDLVHIAFSCKILTANDGAIIKTAGWLLESTLRNFPFPTVSNGWGAMQTYNQVIGWNVSTQFLKIQNGHHGTWTVTSPEGDLLKSGKVYIGHVHGGGIFNYFVLASEGADYNIPTGSFIQIMGTFKTG